MESLRFCYLSEGKSIKYNHHYKENCYPVQTMLHTYRDLFLGGKMQLVACFLCSTSFKHLFLYILLYLLLSKNNFLWYMKYDIIKDHALCCTWFKKL